MNVNFFLATFPPLCENINIKAAVIPAGCCNPQSGCVAAICEVRNNNSACCRLTICSTCPNSWSPHNHLWSGTLIIPILQAGKPRLRGVLLAGPKSSFSYCSYDLCSHGLQKKHRICHIQGLNINYLGV